MIQKDYTKELEKILKALHNEDDDENYTQARRILYDWSIHITLCIGAIQVITAMEAPSSIDSNQLRVLKEAEERLEGIFGSMRNALINDSHEI